MISTLMTGTSCLMLNVRAVFMKISELSTHSLSSSPFPCGSLGALEVKRQRVDLPTRAGRLRAPASAGSIPRAARASLRNLAPVSTSGDEFVPPPIVERSIAPALPASRTEAVRLNKTLDTLLQRAAGDWSSRCQVYNAILCELVLQVSVNCAERGELLNRLRTFYEQLQRRISDCVSQHRDMQATVRQLTDEMEESKLLLGREAEQRAQAEGSLAALRGSMVHLKLLRLVHGRKLHAEKMKVFEVSLRLRQIEAAVIQAGHEHLLPGPPQEEAPKRPVDTRVAPVSSHSQSASDGESPGNDPVGQQEVWNKRLAAKDEQLARLRLEKEELEHRLRSSEQEVSALLAGIERATQSQRQVRLESSSVANDADQKLSSLRQELTTSEAEAGQLREQSKKLKQALKAAEASNKAAAATAQAQEELLSRTVGELGRAREKLKWWQAVQRKRPGSSEEKCVQTVGPSTSHANTQTLAAVMNSGERASGLSNNAAAVTGALSERACEAEGRVEEPQKQPMAVGPLEGGSVDHLTISSGKHHHQGRSRMVKSLMAANAMPMWAVCKIVSTFLRARVLHGHMVSLDSEENTQHFSEFVEDRFVETFGMRTLATENLRDLIAGLQQYSGLHVRLSTFRSLTGLVPGDGERTGSAAEFYCLLLRLVVDVLEDDQLSGVGTELFWKHFGRHGRIRISVAYLDQMTDKLAAIVQAAQADAKGHGASRHLTRSRRLRSFVQGLECMISALDALPAIDQAHADEKNIAESGKRPTLEIGGASERERVDFDLFLESAVSKWRQAEEVRKDAMLKAFESWDADGNRHMPFVDFERMLTFANGELVTKRMVGNVFLLSTWKDRLDPDELGRVLLAHDLSLLPKPTAKAGLAASSDTLLPSNRDDHLQQHRFQSTLHVISQFSRAQMGAVSGEELKNELSAEKETGLEEEIQKLEDDYSSKFRRGVGLAATSDKGKAHGHHGKHTHTDHGHHHTHHSHHEHHSHREHDHEQPSHREKKGSRRRSV